jgi:hypothetical protein
VAHTYQSICEEYKLTTLVGANLFSADLAGANLKGANLEGANLESANLSGANLEGANLHLMQTNLVGATLVKANLVGAWLAEANLEGANLEGATLYEASLREANLTNANLKGVKLNKTELANANLTGANLEHTVLDPKCTGCSSERQLIEAGLEVKGEYVYGWRTQYSEHVGNTFYAPGSVYVAPVFSICALTSCHPGIYFASDEYLDDHNYSANRVYCRSLVKDCLLVGGKVRTRRLEILVGDGK